MISERKQRFIVTLLIAIIIGLVSGVVGSIVARVYLLERTFNVPFVGGIDYSSGQSGSSLVIQGAKKVVVEQNAKIIETVESVKNNIVGIFPVITGLSDSKVGATAATGTELDIDKLYLKNNELAQGLVLTTDGWLITNFRPKEISASAKDTLATSTRDAIIKNYIVMTSDQEIYELSNIVWDSASGYSFWRINANDLPVRRLVSEDEISNGELLLAVNWDGWARLATLSGRISSDDALVSSSDELSSEFILDDELGEDFWGTFIFNLNGDVVALIDSEGTVRSISNYFSCIACLLEKRIIERPYLGLYYAHLPHLVGQDSSQPMFGALVTENEQKIAIAKGSPADVAGLKEGDIILFIDGIEIKNNTTVSRVINRFKPGDEIEIIYSRGGVQKTVKVVLGKL